MSFLVIDGLKANTYRGPIELPRFRVSTFAPTRTAGVGVQLLPQVGPSFAIETTFLMAASGRRTVATNIDARKGSVVTVVEDGLDYSVSPYFVKFLITDIRHREVRVIARAVGDLDGAAFDYAPAGRVVTEWTMRAVPA